MPTKSITNADPVQEVLSRLRKVKPTGASSWEACCPSHDDGSPSLSVSRGDDGRALLHCHAGCATSEIVADLGLTLADLFVRNGSPKPAKSQGPTFDTLEAYAATLGDTHGGTWMYTDIQGNPLLGVVRIETADAKKFQQLRPVAGGWAFKAPTGPRPLFNLPELANAARIVVLEGEKCCDTARTLGYISTTSAGGAQSPQKTDWTPLAGRDVVILPDNDAPGRAYAETVAKILTGLQPPARVRIVALPGLPERGDLVDFVDERDCTDTTDIVRGLDELIDAAPWFVPSVDTAESEPRTKSVRDTLEWQPFPVDALPNEIGYIIGEVATAMSIDPSMLALPLLVVFAGAIGNSRRLQVKRGWYAPSIVWGSIVADSGEVKTPAIQFGQRILSRRYKRAIREHTEAVQRFQTDLSDYTVKRKAEGDACTTRKPQEPTLVRCLISDATIEAIAPIHKENPRGLTLIRDELGGWIGSFNAYKGKGRGADLQHWEELHSGIPMIVDRKGGSGAPRQSIFVPRAAVSVVGGIQPGTATRSLTPEYFESGLVARILFAMPPPRLRQWVYNEVPADAEGRMDAIVDRLFELQPEWNRDGEPQPKLVRFTPLAMEKYIAFHNEHCREQFDLQGDLKAAWSKLEGYATRLSLVLHLVRWATGEHVDLDAVDETTVDNAVRLVRWFANEDRRVYAMLSAGGAGRVDRELAELIESRGGQMSVHEIMRTSSRFGTTGEVETTLNRMAKTGVGRWGWDDHGGGRGAPKRLFILGVDDINAENG